MPYIGRPLNAGNLAVQSGTGDGSDTTPIATLDYSVGSSNSIGVYLDGVRQLAGTDFTASGTVLTFTTAPANGVGVDVYFLGLELSIPTPADATVTTAKIVDDAVTLAKMAPGTDGNLITYDASGNPAAVATGSSGQVLTSAGAGAPPTFSAAPSHTGNVAFPATQSASGDANTLDDYEEGTWTPVVGGAGGTSGQGYGEQHGSYVKIGRMVTCVGTTTFSAKGTVTGNVTLSGLPFAMANLRQNRGAGTVTGWYALGNNMVDVRLLGNENASTASFLHLESAQANQANQSMVTADLTNTSEMYYSLTYLS